MNSVRGEIELKLGEQQLLLCPSFQALVEIEHATGVGIITLARRLHEGNLGLNDIVAIIYHCAKAQNASLHEEVIVSLITHHGIVACIKPLSILLANALGGFANNDARG